MASTVSCRVCGEEFGQISPFHVRKHGIESLKRYKELFPGALVVSEEVAQRIAEKRKGQKPTEETRAKLREARKGKTPCKGKAWTGEERARMSASCKKVQKTPEWNRKNSEGQRGKIIPFDARLKMSVSAVKRIEQGCNPLATNEAKAHLAAIRLTDEYKRHHAEGQARSYRITLYDGLNVRVAQALTSIGIRYEREFLFPGKAPYRYDFAFPESSVLLEVQGCRWHMCAQCNVVAGLSDKHKSQRSRIDKAKKSYAENKGWTLLVYWEHDLLGTPRPSSTIAGLAEEKAHLQAYLQKRLTPILNSVLYKCA